ncbi:hypothetical protein C2G38_297663 [Gigaspora rosea]|uniref:Uncharacterized protein n=1 Tax=Gigaspora rosea TaxID=44941 RepID=A0A397UIN2_9GLOM|nr:hypothetical protein C2G38_297663 [Gigaspora rosea]
MNSKISKLSEVIVLSDTDDESIAAAKTESLDSGAVSNNKSGRISVTTSNEGRIQRQPSVLSYESNNTDESVSDDFEDELVALNNRLKDNIVNSSFETNNESELSASDIRQPTFAQFGRNLSVDQIEYFLEFQEYPKTSPTGVASIYNVSGWEPDKAKKAFGIVNLQYSYGNPGNIQSIKKCPFLGVPVRKTYRTCFSVKVCEFSSPELNIEHTFVDFENQLYKKIFDSNESSVHTVTLNTFGKAHNTPCSYIDPITNIQCNEYFNFR